MRTLALTFSIIVSSFILGQNYQLIPSECTFCFYLSSPGTNTWDSNVYEIDPYNDTMINGQTYTIGPYTPFSVPIAYRQVGNKLYGILPDTLTEYLIQDFDAEVGDTIFNLFSEGILYNAYVSVKDSILVNGGNYHHFMYLEAFEYSNPNPINWITEYWSLSWNERGLCNDGGGWVYNVSNTLLSISAQYAMAIYCTTDPMYNHSSSVDCTNCIPWTNSIEEFDNESINLFPNPANSIINIESDISIIDRIEILDLKGKIACSEEVSSKSTKIDIEKLQPGLHLIRIYYGDRLAIMKFVKN